MASTWVQGGAQALGVADLPTGLRRGLEQCLGLGREIRRPPGGVGPVAVQGVFEASVVHIVQI